MTQWDKISEQVRMPEINEINKTDPPPKKNLDLTALVYN